MDDLISRQQAINALKNDMASLDHIIKGMSAYDVRLDAYVSQRNQVDCDIDTISNLPTAQPEQLGTNLAEVGTEERAEERTETHACDCINRQQAIDEIDEWIKAFRENGHKESAADACLIQDGIIQLPPAQPEPCEDAVSRKAAIDGLNDAVHEHNITDFDAVATILALPPVTPKQPDLSEAYANAVFTWLMSYQIQSAQLKGRYTPYEVIGWVLNDWRKEHDAERDT